MSNKKRTGKGNKPRWIINFSINVLSLSHFLASIILFFIRLYHDVGASFIPTVPPSLSRLRLGKWLRKLIWKCGHTFCGHILWINVPNSSQQSKVTEYLTRFNYRWKTPRKEGFLTAERGGFEPPLRGYRKHAFQACAFKLLYREATSFIDGSVSLTGVSLSSFPACFSYDGKSSFSRLSGILQYRSVVPMLVCPISSRIWGILPLVWSLLIQP